MKNPSLILLTLLCLNACKQDKGGPTNAQLIEVTCRYMSEGRFYKLNNEAENETQRTLLYQCVLEGYLTAQKTTPQSIDTAHEHLTNRLGRELEKRNIWFYTEDDKGKQFVGLNLYNPQNILVSWVTVGFYPSACGVKQDAPYVLFLPVPNPLLRKDQAVLTWAMPSDLRIENGCLDILAAGDDRMLRKKENKPHEAKEYDPEKQNI